MGVDEGKAALAIWKSCESETGKFDRSVHPPDDVGGVLMGDH